MSDVGQHLLSGKCALVSNFAKDFFHLSSPGALSGLMSTLLFQPCTSVPSCASCPSSREAPPVDLLKTRLQQGDASLRTKSALPVLMRTNLTLPLCPVKPVPFAPSHGRSSLPPEYSVFGAAIRIVNPVHSFASSFLFLDWLFVLRVDSDNTRP